MEKMNVGIDFGTCYSSVAVDSGNRVEALELQEGRRVIPSSVYLNEDGSMEFGERAENLKRLNPRRYRTHFKRDLGSSTPCDLEGTKFHPHELVAKILRLAFDRLRNNGWSPDSNSSVTITVPATHQKKKQELMRAAAAEAGFPRDRIRVESEPVAAAAHYISSTSAPIGERMLVYDFGGGTFDAAIIRKEAIGFKVVSMPAGIERLGGNDFDDKIYKSVIEETDIPNKVRLTSGESRDIGLQHFVKDECRVIKHALSDRESADCVLPHPLSVFSMTRRGFESLIVDEVEKTLAVCQQLLAEAELTWRRISRILMVGGSCRIPYVRRRLEALSGRPVLLAAEPKLTVCLGAALIPSLLEQEDRVHAPAMTAIQLMRDRLSWDDRKKLQAIHRHRAHIYDLRHHEDDRSLVAVFLQKVLQWTANVDNESISETASFAEDFKLVDIEKRELAISIETLLVASPAVCSRVGQIADEVLKTGVYTTAVHDQLRAELSGIRSPGSLTNEIMACKTVDELIDKTFHFLQHYKAELSKPPGVMIYAF